MQQWLPFSCSTRWGRLIKIHTHSCLQSLCHLSPHSQIKTKELFWIFSVMSNQTFFLETVRKKFYSENTQKVPLLPWKNVDFPYFLYFDLCQFKCDTDTLFTCSQYLFLLCSCKFPQLPYFKLLSPINPVISSFIWCKMCFSPDPSFTWWLLIISYCNTGV